MKHMLTPAAAGMGELKDSAIARRSPDESRTVKGSVMQNHTCDGYRSICSPSERVEHSLFGCGVQLKDSATADLNGRNSMCAVACTTSRSSAIQVTCRVPD